MQATRKMVRSSWVVVEEHRRAYLILNLVYYGLMVGGMVYAAFDRALQEALLELVGEAFATGPLGEVSGAYSGGRILLAAALTFVVNLAGGSFASITLPSLIIPLSGLLVGAYRAVLWGLLFSPTAVMGAGIVFQLPTLLLEGQAYVLTMLAAYAQGVAFLRPRSVGAETHLRGYRVGVKRSIRIYVLVVIVLALAALYEAASVILLMQNAAS